MESNIKTYGNFKNIKSQKILKFIFSFLFKNKKLDIISYNNQIKRILKVNFDDYKIAGNLEKIGNRNGYGKEYIKGTNLLIFEGEYKNGRRNGKGKEYYEYNKIKFEGEYLNGKKISGKKYDEDGNIILILQNAKGKEINKDNIIRFEGEYFNGRRWNGIG